jgi:hypothetical protein
VSIHKHNWSFFDKILDLSKAAACYRLPYFVDAVFCILFLFPSSSQKRHSLGFFSLIPSVALEVLRLCLSTQRRIQPPFEPKILINNIPTPAHECSWMPLWQELSNGGKSGCVAMIHPESATLHLASGSHYNHRVLRVSDVLLLLCRAAALFFCTVRILIHDGSLLRHLIARAPLLFEYCIRFAASERIYEKAFPQLHTFITTYELDYATKALACTLRTRSLRVIHIMHGQRLPTYQVTMATDLVLFSKIDEPWFRARIDPSIRIWTIGHPRLEDVRCKVGPVRGNHNRLPRITFFSQPSEGDYSRDLRLADWRICASLEGKADVRFRAHPREDKSRLKADMAAAGIDFMQISDAGLIEDLIWCDAVASSWSTVSMEAAACGRGIFWTCSTPERYEAPQELRDHGIGTLVQYAQDWEKHLAEWQSGEWGEPIRVSEARLRELGMIGDMEKSWFERLGIE